MGSFTTERAQIATFKSPAVTDITGIKAYISPVQEGSGDPSPDNIRPISGWTGATITRCGKNLYDASQPLLRGWLNPDGSAGGVSGSGNKHTYKIPIKSGSVYTYSVLIATSAGRTSCWYDSEDNVVGYFQLSSGQKHITATAPENAVSVSLTIYNVDGQQIQFEIGDTVTDYEPYVGTTIPVNCETDAGTVYGGYLTVDNGEAVLTVTHRYEQLVRSGWALSGQNFWHSLSEASNTNPANLGWCTHYKSTERLSGNNTIIFGYRSFSSAPRVVIRDSRFTTTDDFMAYLNEQYENETPVKVAYPLATPQTYNLGPVESLTTLFGDNNVFTDTGDIEVTYNVVDAPGMLDIRKRILIAQPHIEKLSGEGIITFKTDVPANLKALKIHFSPVQEGEGDPSLDNIRAISGWDEIGVGASNENLLPKEPPTEGVYTVAEKSGVWGSATNARRCAIIPYPYGKTILAQKKTSGTSGGMSVGDTRVLVIGGKYYEYTGFSNLIRAAFTNNDNHKYLYFGSSTLNNFNSYWSTQKFMISIGTNWKTYVAPQGTIHWIDFSDIGTVYGGYIDLVNGELIETHRIFTFDGDETYTKASIPYVRFEIAGKYAGAYSRRNEVISNMYAKVVTNGNRDKAIRVSGSSSVPQINTLFIYDTRFIDEETTRSILSADPVQIYYPLYTPIHHQLTPETIKTLKGVNNIWSNANGPIEIACWKH